MAMESSRALRRFIGRRKFVLLTLAAGILCGGFWYDRHRTLSWRDTVSPAFWYRHIRGLDIYDAEHSLLMRGSYDRPEVALTFDDGPHPESRARILDILKQYGAKATFFDVGQRMAERPDLLRRTLAEGHEIANHSMNHNRLPALSSHERHREINDTDIVYYGITGQHLNLMRPPGMQYDAPTLLETKSLGYIVVGYTTLSDDYNLSESAGNIAYRSVRRSGNGSIILLHDYAPTADALPAILQQLKARGFRFVTVSEMIDHLPAASRQAALSFRAQHL